MIDCILKLLKNVDALNLAGKSENDNSNSS